MQVGSSQTLGMSFANASRPANPPWAEAGPELDLQFRARQPVRGTLSGDRSKTTLPNSQQREYLLQLAEWMLDRIAGLWNATPLTSKYRLQSALFPDGIMVSQEGDRTE